VCPWGASVFGVTSVVTQKLLSWKIHGLQFHICTKATGSK
jgi:hypothetical protein